MQADISYQTTSKIQKKPFIGSGPFIQKKLSIGASNDHLEVEADRIADQVVGMNNSQSHLTQHSGSLVQRKCDSCAENEEIQKKSLAHTVSPAVQKSTAGSEGGTASKALTNQINSSKGSGNKMDAGTQQFMESRFGSDFSQINIHTGSEAVQMSRELNARAFTVGNDVYFNQGQYNPSSTWGKHLLAHELTHTLQQSSGIQRISRSCTQRSAGECCRNAKANGLDNGDAGGVVCCDGRKVACNWYWLPDGAPNDFIENIIRDCVTEHELTHFDDIDACGEACPSLTRPNFRSGADQNAEECKGYKAELACFKNKISLCDTLSNAAHKTRCRDVIQNTWIADRTRQVANLC